MIKRLLRGGVLALFVLLAACDLVVPPGKPGQLALQPGMQFVGTVEKVADGDTVTVRLGGDQARLRLAYIDSPEKRQAYGETAARRLRDWLRGREVKVDVVEIDRYGRGVALIELDGEPVNLRQVENGQAWFYRQYAKGLSRSERARFASAESQAQRERRGLWRQGEATPPWDWRRAQRAGN